MPEKGAPPKVSKLQRRVLDAVSAPKKTEKPKEKAKV